VGGVWIDFWLKMRDYCIFSAFLVKCIYMEKAYEPNLYEDKIYKLWEESGFFNPDVCIENGICDKNAEHFSVVLPPPNITDKLHLGHVVMVAITDILARYHRMNGKRVCWIPGTDHAALATQNVVEKRLWQDKKQTRHDLGREKFLIEVQNFVSKTQTTIIHQLHKTGASLDWSRLAFTLDDQRQKAVKQMFVDMYNEGIIYQGYRMVNWCPRCQSTLSDDEVEYKTTRTKLYWLKYGPFILATTRPETKLGDTAVAVHPKDKRYQKMVGKKFMIPGVLGEFEITVVADEAVDMEFGTGAIKVTPYHSFADYEIAERHGISGKQIINEEGKLMENCGKYAGLTTLEAREAIVKDMEIMGLIDRVDENYENNLSICSRCGATIEPLPSKQWFVAVDKKIKRLGNKSLKERALEVAREDKIKFTPERFKKRYLDWMENLHDWCISRQLWYGHQLPVWYRSANAHDESEKIYVGIEAPKGDGWEQEEDVLDTWFSSGMWTFSTMGYPDLNAPDLKNYQPTQILETGYEIITLWVSRMIMMSLFALNKIPFENVYLHGMILDQNGKKMSKSKGNGIDPLEMISKYGTDATRLSLIVGNTPGNDSRISEEKIADYRNFANKLWNIARFISFVIPTETREAGRVEGSLSEARKGISRLPSVAQNDSGYTLSDKWILSRLNETIKTVTENIEKFNFSYAGEVLRDFTWGELADWYLEIAKIEGDKDTILNYILETILKLWHPFMPFVTETIWTDMGHGTHNTEHDMLMVSGWPSVIARSEVRATRQSNSNDFNLVKDIISGIRSLRADYKIDPVKKLKVVISAGKKEKLIEENSKVIIGLARLESLEYGRLPAEEAGKPVGSVGFVVGEVEVFVDLSGVVDLEKEKARLKSEIENLEKYLRGLEMKFGNESFVKNAPKEVVEKEKAKMEEAKNKIIKLKGQLLSLK